MCRTGTMVGAALLIACGEPERNEPAPPGMSAGSVTIGGGGASTAPTTAATDDPQGSTSGATVSTSMPPTTASTGDTLPGETGFETSDTILDPPTTGAAGCSAPGEACEGDGVCVEHVVPGGLEISCSHGTTGEPCALDSHCLSQMCVTEVTARGVVSTCT